MVIRVVDLSLVSWVIYQKVRNGKRMRRGSPSGTTDNKRNNTGTHELRICSEELQGRTTTTKRKWGLVVNQCFSVVSSENIGKDTGPSNRRKKIKERAPTTSSPLRSGGH